MCNNNKVNKKKIKNDNNQNKEENNYNNKDKKQEIQDELKTHNSDKKVEVLLEKKVLQAEMAIKNTLEILSKTKISRDEMIVNLHKIIDHFFATLEKNESNAFEINKSASDVENSNMEANDDT